MKLVEAVRKGSRRTRHYDPPRTPLDRLLEIKSGDQEKVEALQALRERTDPFDLAEQIQKKLETIWSLRHLRPKSPQPKREKEKMKASEQEVLKSLSKIFGMNVYVRTTRGGPLVRISQGKIFK